MNLLAAALYDPAAAVSKATSSLIAMTAFDTTNLRLSVTVPAHGKVRVKLRCAITGATTLPTILLGVLEGATVRARVTPLMFPGTANATTQSVVAEADFIITGLSAGTVNWDAAYGVEVTVASTNVKYGGPNDTTTNNAWGAFCFEVWDPAPIGTAGASLTALGDTRIANLDAAVTTRMASYTQPTGFLAATFPGTVASTTNITAGTITTVTNLTNAATAGDLTATMKTSVTTAATAATPTVTAGTVSDKTGYSLTQTFPSNFSSLGINASGHISRVVLADTLTTYTGNTVQTGDAYARIGVAGVGLTNLGDTRVANLDATTSSRMASYTQPTGFLAATFPGAVASTTNITAGTITTVTNLTNAPTAGDLTSTMKTSVATAVLDGVLTGHTTADTVGRALKYSLAFVANKKTIATDTLTIYDNDAVTTLYTLTLTPSGGPYTAQA